MVKKLLFLNIALLCCQLAMVQAQSISPKVISSAGSTATGGSSIINYNLGEPIIGTLTGGSYQITQGFEQPGGVNSSLLTGLVSYWKLDESTGQARDTAGGGNHGTNTSITRPAAGKINTAYAYNDTTASGTLMTDASNLRFTTSGALSAWVLITAIKSGDQNSYYYGAIVNKQDYGNDIKGYSIFYNSYGNNFAGELASDTAHQGFNFNVTPAINTWYNLMVAWRGDSIWTYVNGVLSYGIKQNVVPASNGYPFAIGFQGNNNSNHFRGRIDEVGAWSRALTAKEDSLLYAAGYGNTYPFDGSGNVLPTANAGANQTLAAGITSTTLTGSGTGTAITYAWTKVSGPTGGTITTPTAATTTITALTAGTYAYQLTVTDNLANTASSIVNITVNPVPTANAGTNQYLTATTTSTTLTGSGTGNGLTYAWTRTAGASASITAPSSATTGITGLTLGAYTFRLTVTDNKGTQASGIVNVTVDPVPMANAGANQALPYTTSTTLSGSATGSNLRYAWTETAGAAATITNAAQLSTTVTGLAPGAYSFLLTVTDSSGQQATSAVNVAVNQLVTSNAGPDQTLSATTTTTTLNGTGSGTGISYSWLQIGGPNATIGSPASASTGVTGLSQGVVDTFRLTVTDNIGTIARDTVIVRVLPMPTAYAGPNQTLYQGVTSSIVSATATGTAITYAWTQTGGTTATITSPTLLKTTITGLSSGLSTFLLTVTDSLGTQVTSSVQINIYASGAPSLLNGLISYWDLNEASGGIAFDHAGGGNNGTNNLVFQGNNPGKIGTDYIYAYYDTLSTGTLMSNAPNLSFGAFGSLSAWVNIPVPADTFDVNNHYYGSIINKGNSTTDRNGYNIIYDSYNNTIYGELANASTFEGFNFNFHPVANQWYHIAVTWDGSNINTYVNGALSVTKPQTLTPVSSVWPFAIGYAPATNNTFFRGQIDEVGAWNRALTGPEVASLYNSNLGYAYPFAPLGGTPVGVSAIPAQPLVTTDVNTSVTAYPNPYSTEVNFNMKSSAGGRGSLTLYDLLGRKVATVFEGDLQAGSETKATYRLGGAKRQVLIYLFRVGDKTVQGKLIPGKY